jgi:LysM repeat protein
MKGDKIIMNFKSHLRILIILMLASLVVIGLTSCVLSASKGPLSGDTTNEGFPVPGETEQTSGGIDVSTFATQTAQAKPPVVVSQEPASSENPTQAAPYPANTSVPEAPTVTPTPITYVEPPPSTLPTTYTLQQGEYPFCIARRFDVNQAELLELNALAMDTLVGPGTELKIPQTGNPFDGTRALQEHPSTYTVEEGDTLGSIACYYGDVSPELISLQNNLSSDEVDPGTELVIP